METPPHQREYGEIRDFLRRFVRRFRTVRGMEGLCLTAAAALVLAALGIGVDAVKERLPYAPLALSLLSWATLLALAGYTLLCFLRPHGLSWAARCIERQRPELRNNLINSLQLYPQLAGPADAAGASAPMILALVRQTREQVRAIRLADVVDCRPLKAKARLLALVAAPVLALAAWDPGFPGRTLALAVHPLEHLPPADIFIHVVTRDVRVVRGTSVAVEAVTSGAEPGRVVLAFRPSASGDGGEAGQTAAMERTGPDRYAALVPEVTEDLDYRVATGPFASPWYRIAATERPAVTDLTVTLYPPHYTGLPNETLAGGNVRGVKGSTLGFTITTNKPVARAVLALDDGREVPLKLTGDRAQGSMVLFRSQRYRIRMEDPFGFENLPAPYEMHAVPDGFPVVELLRPAEDLEVNGDERLVLEYRAEDDYGVREIVLAARVGDREERLPVWRRDPARTLQDRFVWDLDAMRLEQGDVVTYHLEVLDNDTISGPKLGKSRPFSLRLKNLEVEHRQVTEMVRDLSDRMVDLLADHLESGPGEAPPDPAEPPPEERLAEGLHRMTERVDEVMARTRNDRMSDFATWSDLETLKRNLEYAGAELLDEMRRASSAGERERAHDEMATDLERMSMLSEDMSRRLAGQNAESNARDMLKGQERFLDSLEKLRSGHKELDEVLDELSRLSSRLRELQASLMRFARDLPSEFLNPESMRNMPFADMRSGMDEIRRKLREGDIQGALQLARELFNQMAQLAASLRSGQQQAQTSMMARMQGAMSQSGNELQQILQEQQDILLGTESSHRENTRELEERRREALERLAAETQARLESLARLLTDRELQEAQGLPGTADRDAVSIHPLLADLLSLLADGDFAAFAQQLDPALDRLDRPLTEDQKKGVAAMAELAREYRALGRIPAPELTAPQMEAVRDLAVRQGVIEERTRDLAERLRHLFQLFPSLDPKIVRDVAEASGFMGRAAHELGRLAPGMAIPPEQEAVRRLTDSSRQMQAAMQRLAQRGRLGRVPLVRLFRDGRFIPSGRSAPPAGTPRFPDFDVDESLAGLDTDKVELPGKDDYKPEKFRKEILEALKQGVPDRYREQVESYFRELSQ